MLPSKVLGILLKYIDAHFSGKFVRQLLINFKFIKSLKEMVAPAAFPIAKLGVLLVKQINKPLARNLVKIAQKNKPFRDYVGVPLGQFFHYVEMKLKLKSLNIVAIKWKSTKIPKLDEQDAIEQGSNLLSELIILNFAADVLIYEYKKQQSEKQKEEDMKQMII